MNKEEYIKMSLEEREEYSKNVSSNEWFPPMWWVEISKVHGDIVKEPYKHTSVDGFFVLRKDLEALYEKMDYLNVEAHGKEFTTDWFEERYGLEEKEK